MPKKTDHCEKWNKQVDPDNSPVIVHRGKFVIMIRGTKSNKNPQNLEFPMKG